MGNEYFDLGSYSRKVTTSSSEAQKWFDRGLLWAYSFNHEESFHCFERAAQHDAACAMAHWGIAYALGPNYNKTWTRFEEKERAFSIERALSALASAKEAAATQSTPTERALVEALAARFPPQGAHFPADPLTLDDDYIDAMRSVYKHYADDQDVAALFADSIMVRHSRRLWNLKTRQPTGSYTKEALTVIETAMSHPAGRYHPAHCHLYIHLMEMSPNPAVAQPAADRLRRLVPEGSHMQHMATHIDIACGDYSRGIESNWNAMLADDKYFATSKGSHIYTAYRAHNVRVMGYAAMMSGRSEIALTAAKKILKILTPELLQVESPNMLNWLEWQGGMLAHVLIRFGLWEEILRLEIPRDQRLWAQSTAFTHYAQSIALGVLGRIEEAKAARERFREAALAIPEQRVYAIFTTGRRVMQVASFMLDGELAYREGDFDTAFATLRKAVAAEDDLPYSDPPMWLQPVRHALGALLLEQGHVVEALEVYRQDLGFSDQVDARVARPNNIWGLQGLLESLERLGKRDEANIVRNQFEIMAGSADVTVGVSCFCRRQDKAAQPKQCCD